jgi:hypothetical protein
MLIGILNDFDDSELEFHMEDNKFTNGTEDLERFAVCSNSPWSYADETYTIKYNCKDSYSGINENEPNWKCEYQVVGYEMITSIIYGFGDTQQEALQNCMNIFDRLQKEFNKDNKSF